MQKKDLKKNKQTKKTLHNHRCPDLEEAKRKKKAVYDMIYAFLGF